MIINLEVLTPTLPAVTEFRLFSNAWRVTLDEMLLSTNTSLTADISNKVYLQLTLAQDNIS